MDYFSNQKVFLSIHADQNELQIKLVLQFYNLT